MGTKQLPGAGEGTRASLEKDNELSAASCGDLCVKAAWSQFNFSCACRTELSKVFCLVLPLKC